MKPSPLNLFQQHPRESELIGALLNILPEELRGRVHIWAEASGRVHIHPRGLKRSQWWRVHEIITEKLGGYWRSEPWPELPYWSIPARKALRLIERGLPGVCQGEPERALRPQGTEGF